MTTRITINGVTTDEPNARISVLDRGFLYGDSIYEVIRTYGGRPFALVEHLERLQRSAELLQIALPVDADTLRAEIETTLAAADNAESYVRVIITRGAGPIGLDPALAQNPCRVIIVTELTPFPDEIYRRGATIALVPAGRLTGGAVPLGAKSGNYLVNVMALGVARRRGAHEAVLVDAGGRVAEGASSNIFAVFDRRLRTPALTVGILEGITRHKVIDLARGLALEVQETELRPDELRHADEIFITSTLREVLPVTQVDDWTVGDGRVGPVALELRRRYQELTRE